MQYISYTSGLLAIFYALLPLFIWGVFMFGKGIITQQSLRNAATAWMAVAMLAPWLAAVEHMGDSQAAFNDFQTIAFIGFLGFVFILILEIRMAISNPEVFEYRPYEREAAPEPAAPSAPASMLGREVDISA